MNISNRASKLLQQMAPHKATGAADAGTSCSGGVYPGMLSYYAQAGAHRHLYHHFFILQNASYCADRDFPRHARIYPH